MKIILICIFFSVFSLLLSSSSVSCEEIDQNESINNYKRDANETGKNVIRIDLLNYKFISSIGDFNSRGLFSSFGNVASNKFHELSSILKDTLNIHHEKIGGLHKSIQNCFQRLLNVEKMILGLKEEKPTYDYNELTEKIKDIVAEYVNPQDLQSMSGYLQGQLRYLDYRLQTVDRYLALAFQHIKYLERYRTGGSSYYRPSSPSHKLYGVKVRDENRTDGPTVSSPSSSLLLP